MQRVTGLNQYQQLTRRTQDPSKGREYLLCNYALGLCGEAMEAGELVVAIDPRYGELAREAMASASRLAEYVKNVFHRRDDLDTTKAELRKELGDLLWYVARMAEVLLDAGLEDIASENIEKLQKRYPEGFVRKEGMKA